GARPRRDRVALPERRRGRGAGVPAAAALTPAVVLTRQHAISRSRSWAVGPIEAFDRTSRGGIRTAPATRALGVRVVSMLRGGPPPRASSYFWAGSGAEATWSPSGSVGSAAHG